MKYIEYSTERNIFSSALEMPHFTELLKSATVVEGSNVALKCSFTGIPKPHIQWKKNDYDVMSNAVFKVLLLATAAVICLTALKKNNIINVLSICALCNIYIIHLVLVISGIVIGVCVGADVHGYTYSIPTILISTLSIVKLCCFSVNRNEWSNVLHLLFIISYLFVWKCFGHTSYACS